MARVAFLGTGAMGAPMARNLVRAGHDVRVWNRTAERAEGLGATVYATPAEATAGAEIVVTMLSDGPTTAGALDGALGPGQLWLQMGTVGTEWTDRLAALARDAGAAFVDAPVIGSTPAAEAADLVVFAGGDDDEIDRAGAVLSAVSRETQRVGRVGDASRLKLVFNYWVLGLTALTGEVISLADVLGVGGARFLRLIEGGFADAPYAQLKGKKMVAEDWSPLFKLALGRKDAALALEAAADAGLDLPVARAVLAEFDGAIERGFGEDDTAAVVRAVAPG